MHKRAHSPNDFETTIGTEIIAMDGINGCVVIQDNHNSDLNSLNNVLDLLKRQRKNNRCTAIISDIEEAGERTPKQYGAIANLVKSKGIDRFIGIGPELCQNQNQFEGIETEFYQGTDAFIESFSAMDFIHENVLVKGEPNFSFVNITALLQKKRHETILEINLKNVLNNYNYLKSKLKPETKMMVMVKAFAYGSGSYEVGQLLEYHNAEYLSVAYADEGVTLREDGIKAPIMVLNPEISAYAEMIRYQLEPQIFSFRTLKHFTEALDEVAFSDEPYPIHIKLNTGMNRLGFEPNEMEQLGRELSENHNVKVVSVFSHLSGSDESRFDDLTATQFQTFVSASADLENQISYPFMRHILNSNGVLRHPDYQLDMVRVGIALYGFSSQLESRKELKPVSRLVTTISQIREVDEGKQIGYNPKSKLNSNRKIAVLAIGYADGYPRLLGNGVGRVYINGKFAPTVGNICMDMCMVDVTSIECKEGDLAEVFGENVEVYELAEKLKTIPYEVLTNISQRVKRISIHS